MNQSICKFSSCQVKQNYYSRYIYYTDPYSNAVERLNISLRRYTIRPYFIDFNFQIGKRFIQVQSEFHVLLGYSITNQDGICLN